MSVSTEGKSQALWLLARTLTYNALSVPRRKGVCSKRGRNFVVLVPSTQYVTLAARRLVELQVVSFAILERCDASPRMLRDLGRHLDTLLLQITHGLL